MVGKARKLAEFNRGENGNRVRSKGRIWGSGRSEFRKRKGSGKEDGEGSANVEGEPEEGRFWKLSRDSVPGTVWGPFR